MQRNHFQEHRQRILKFQKKSNSFNSKYYFTSKYRKQCFLSFSYRVPQARLGVSRFILVRGADYLTFGPFKHR